MSNEDFKVWMALLFGGIMAVLALVSVCIGDFGDAWGYGCVGGAIGIYVVYKLAPL